MPLLKTAIAVPADLLAAVDEIARERHESRSRFITQVLRWAARARRDAEITRKLDELFSSPQMVAEQRRETPRSWTRPGPIGRMSAGDMRKGEDSLLRPSIVNAFPSSRLSF